MAFRKLCLVWLVLFVFGCKTETGDNATANLESTVAPETALPSSIAGFKSVECKIETPDKLFVRVLVDGSTRPDESDVSITDNLGRSISKFSAKMTKESLGSNDAFQRYTWLYRDGGAKLEIVHVTRRSGGPGGGDYVVQQPGRDRVRYDFDSCTLR
ncbi:MAG: hypothetical protein NTV34_14720 [Proteobacteria bacterium]|nr:hypothetical protein [Pseudomonadota bacterium]